MKIGIICASDDELAPFLAVIDNCRITEKAMLRFYEGQICDVQAVALFSGACRVNAAIATQILIDLFEADRELVKISEAAVKETELQGKVFWGRIVTGEAFITNEGREKINHEFAPLAVDMETAGVAHVYYVNM